MSSFNLIDVVELLNKANNVGIKITLDDDRLKIKMRKDQVIDSSLLEELKLRKEHLITYFKKHSAATVIADENKIVPFERGTIKHIPLSSGQERLWFLDQLEGSTAYHIPTVLRLKGKLDQGALEFALNGIVNRHEVLRTVILGEDGKPYQHILPENKWKLVVLDDLIYKSSPEALRAGIKELTDAPFNLAADHMLRAYLIVLGADEYVLLVTMHHIASDGWSTGIIVNELIEFYNASTEKRQVQLPVLEIQYADYAVWQREQVSPQVEKFHLDYWKKKLNGVATLFLPADYPRPAVQSSRGAVSEFSFDLALAEKLQTLSRSHDATLFMTLLTAFKVLLYRYTGQDDICVGTPTAGRTQQELEGLVGFFVNTLALRSDLGDNPTFEALLQQVKDTTLNAYQHQDLPLEKIVEAVVKERDLSRNPLFQVCFTLLNIPGDGDLKLQDVELSAEPMEQTKIQFDFTLTLRETENGLSGAVEYSTDLYREETISRMVGHFELLLRAIVANPVTRICDLEMLSTTEEQLLLSFNETAVDHELEPGTTLLDAFAIQVEYAPDAIAVVFEEHSLSYKELDERANQLAHYLIVKGVTTETLVPICLGRSLEMIIGIFGILKAGAAYVPIDPDYPASRISYILEDTAASVIITDGNSKPKLPPLADHIEVIALDEEWHEIGAHVKGPVSTSLAAENLAYVIYTSGSTGKPKGVLIEHNGVVNLAMSQRNALRLTYGTRFLQFASFGFDASCYEVFNTLLSGGVLVLPKKEDLLSAESFGAMVKRHQVEVVTLPPSYQHLVKDVLGPVTTVVSAGEPLNREDARYIKAKGIRVINAYGPTENTVCTSLTDEPILENNTVVIGKPIENVQVYIQGEQGRLCPVGVAGELCVGGPGVARGYLKRPELTAEKFIPDTYLPKPGARLYRTGDLARWLPNGHIEYLGRIDDQVKIRGFRIEPGEIEAELQLCELVNAAVIAVKPDQNGNNRLVGYIIPEGSFDREGIVAYLKDKLPDYMIPSILLPLETIPLTPNGKIDRKALPEPTDVIVSVNDYVAPRNPMEQTLTAIWQDLLGVSKVGIHDNFFELGGDSIITIQVVSRSKRAGYDLNPKDLFIYQTVEKLAALLLARKSNEVTAEQGQLVGTAGLLPIQQWFFEATGPNPSHFNQQVLLSIDKAIEPAILIAAVEQLVTYHDALRFAYKAGSHGWEQTYGQHAGALKIVDLQELPASQLLEEITAVCELTQRSLDIEQGILFSAVLIQTPETDAHHRLLFVGHHLVVDGVSWRILLEDIGLLMEHPDQQASIVLGHKSSSYRQWHSALVDYGQRRRLTCQQDYWEKVTAAYHPLKTEKEEKGIVTIADTVNHTATLNSEATRSLLQDTNRAYHTEINDLLLSALALTLAEWNGHGQVSIGLEGHGREDILKDIDTSRTVGWFTSLFPVLLEVEENQDHGSLLKAVKEQLRQVPDKGIGYGVLKYINKTAALQGAEPWDIIFNYLGQMDNAVHAEEALDAAVENTGTAIDEAYPVRENLSVNSVIQGGALLVTWTYSNKHFTAEGISRLAEQYMSHLEELIGHCASQMHVSYTPADYNLSGLVTNGELDNFLEEDFNGTPRRMQLESMYRLSGLQEGMLFHSIYDGQASAYVEQFTGELTELNVPAFLQSWQYLLAHHSILRSGFYYDVFSVPVQCVYHEVELPVTMLDYRHLDEKTQKQAIQEFEANAKLNGFDFTAAPLMRITLTRLEDNRYRLLWNFHHMLLDGWSSPVLLEKLLLAYEALAAGNPLPVIAKDNYEDYIRYTERRDQEEEELYWRGYLKGISEGCLLPFVSTTINRNKGIGEYREQPLVLNAAFSAQLARFAQRHRVTVNTLMQGVWAYLLYRYTGRPDVVYGVTVSGRPEDLPGVERAVGMYINTLPLYTVIDGSAGIIQWLQELQISQLQSREYQHTPLNVTQKWAMVEGDLFDSLLVFENYPVSKVVSDSSDNVELQNAEMREQTNYPLSLIVSSGAVINVVLSYNSTLLEDNYVTAIAAHLEQVLKQILVHETGTLADIELLTVAEQEQLLKTFNHTETAYPQDQTAIGIFEAQVLLYPSSPALVFEDIVYTYQELNERSNQLAGYLRSKGVVTDVLVPVCLARSAEMAIAILGVLKAGGAYVPIDPGYPEDRIAFMLEDTSASVVITTSDLKTSIAAFASADTVLLDTEREKISTWAISRPLNPAGPGDLAYVIYTSGSTGKPKGVMVEHAGMLNHLYAKINDLQLTAETVVAFTASYTFDISVWQLFSALLCGGKTVIYSSERILEPAILIDAVEADGITILELVPSYLNAVLQEHTLAHLNKLSYLLVTGEAVSQPLLAQWFAHPHYGRIPVVNAYGPTEASDDICHHIMYETPSRINVPVGKPVQNMRIYILSASDQLCPVGVPGEICVAGIGVSRGYLNRSELTASRFVDTPFETKGKMYRTGDLGRWLPDGTVEYLGRIDDQVKIRGFRIELGEIENVLQQHEAIVQAAVIVKTDESGNKRLVAYVVAEGVFDREATVSWLKNHLPEYMVPGLFVAMDELPLTGNGKIDRKGLPDPDMGTLQTGVYTAPRNEQETILAEIWQELLHIPKVGIYDNFFELGGDSIITIQVVSRARRAGFSLHPRDLFVHQTIAGLSVCLLTAAETASSGEQGLLDGESGLLPIQQHYFESGAAEISHYNQDVLLSIDKSVTTETVSSAISQLVAAHDVLRFTYTQTADGWKQAYGNYAGALEINDLRQVSSEDLPAVIAANNNQYQSSLDLKAGIVLRTVLLLTPDTEEKNRLLIIVHHLAVDVVSWRILLEDLELLLAKEALPAYKTASYRQWYRSLETYGARHAVQQQRRYWETAVAAARPMRTVNAWSGTLTGGDIEQHTVTLDAVLTRQLLQEVPRAYHTVVNDVLLTALALTLAKWNDHNQVVIGLEGHGREDFIPGVDISRTVGWFTSLYPVMLSVASDADYGLQLKNVKEQLRQIPDKGLGYGILKYINKADVLQGTDPWEVEFNYLGQLDNLVQEEGNTLLSGATESTGSSAAESHPVRELLSINSLVQGGELRMNWSFSNRHFTPDSIAEIAAAYLENLENLINYAIAVEIPVSTPSDYNLGEEITNEELDKFLDEDYNGASRRLQLESISRLSGLQEGMLFHSLYDDQAGAYSKQFSCELVTPDIDAFVQSWYGILKRHSILRSGFYYNEFKIPVQCVYHEVKIPVEILDCSQLNKTEQEQYIRDYESADLKKGFDFTAAPLMRICFIKLDSERYYMLWSHHHILLDGWSMPIVMEELLTNYENLVSGKPMPVLTPDRYEDYIRYIERQDKEEATSYWRKYLDGLDEASLLPFISNASDRTKSHGGYGEEVFQLDAEFTARLTRYAQQNRVTINTLMQGVWSYLLYSYTGRKDVAFGIVVSGRPENLAGVESAVGMYINTLPLHGRVDLAQDFAAGLQQIQTEQLESRAYQYNSLSEIQRLSGITGDLFDTLMVFENYPVSETLNAQPWKLRVENVSSEEHTNYPLSVIIMAGKQIDIHFSHNNLIGHTYIKAIAHHFKTVLEQIASSVKSLKFGELNLLTTAEEQQILYDFNAKNISLLPTETVVELFAAAAAAQVNRAAVITGTDSLSYRELNEQSSRFAHYLRKKGVTKGTLVPVCQERSAGIIVTMLAIMKAGGAYVPIDPGYPAERIQYMLADTAANLLICNAKIAASLGVVEGLEIINPESFTDELKQYPVTAPLIHIELHDLVYVIYTSGSTGQPKGVQITHAGLSNLINWHHERYHLTRDSRTTTAAGVGFDAFGWEVWPTLSTGAALYVVDDEQRLSPSALADYYIGQGITHSFLSTVLIPEFIEASRNRESALKYLLAGGDKLAAVNMEGLTYKIINNYGPTENSVVTTSYELSPAYAETAPPIGIPVSHTQIYILNAANGISPVGVPGELCISGAGLATGYLNRESLTAEKFVSNPFNTNYGGRMYRSGDLARWLPDGNIEYLGRIDDQVKIRGYRIELGEIENVLQQNAAVKHAVVLVKSDDRGHKQLVGYIVAEGSFDKGELIAYLKDRLPDYMVPALWVSLDQLPLTSNGKVDKKMLPEPDISTLLTNSYESPRNATEKALVEIWQDLLRLEQVGIHDNFFELGGDSIITIQAVSRAKRAGYEFQPKDLFVHQTIAGLSKLLQEREHLVSYAEEGFLSGTSGLLPIQQWYFELETPSVSHFNQHVLLTVSKQIAVTIISDSILQLADYHDALRFTYLKKEDHWEQEYGTYTGALETIDLSALATADVPAAIKQAGEIAQRSLDIEQGIIFRSILFLTPGEDQDNRLLLVVHHLAVDGVSWRILLEDLGLLIKEPGKKAVAVLGSKSASYRQWYTALEGYGQTISKQHAYWMDIVKHYVALPEDHNYTGHLTLADMGTKVTRLNSAATQRLLQEVPQAYHTEINDILLCALALALSQWSGISRISVGLEGHGREDIMAGIDTSRTVGWFTNLYPVSLETETGRDIGYALRSIKEQLRKIPAKGIGFGVLKYIEKLVALQQKSAWNVVFNYLGQLDNMVSEQGEIGMANEQAGDSVADDYPLTDQLSVNTMIQGGELLLDWSYSTRHYDVASIDKLADLYMENLQNLIGHCAEQVLPAFTPFDYGLNGLVTVNELDKFLDEAYLGKPRRAQLESIYRLGGLQEGMLFHELYNEQGAFTEQLSCDLMTLQTDKFIRSWEILIKQHSILRTGFYHDAFSIPVQCVYREVSLSVNLLDYRGLSPAAQEQAIQEYEHRDRIQGFDLKAAPLMRICLIQLSDVHYRMLWSFHHILLDGWSVPVLLAELFANYEQLEAGKPIEEQPADRYEDYIRYIAQQDKDQTAAYWRNYLAPAEEGCLLPFVSATADRTRGVGMKEGIIKFDAALTGLISNYAKQQHLTVNSLMQGVWAYLLYRYTGRADVIYGVTVSGRPEDLPGIERKVGMYINTLPLYINLDQSADINSWLQKIQQGQLESREYQYTTLNDIQRLTSIKGDLFDTSIVFQNYPVSESDLQKGGGLEVSDIVVHPQTNYPLTINVITGRETNLLFVHNEELLDTTAVDMMMGHFKQVLLQLVEKGVKTWKEVELMTAQEQEQLLVTFNNKIVAYPDTQTLVDLLLQQAALTPDAPAIVFENTIWSYRKLDEASGKLANYLRSKGVKTDMLVPIYLERSAEMVVAILGVMKAGGAYVPLDTTYPAERISYILKDTSAAIVITTGDISERIYTVSDVPLVLLDQDIAVIKRYPSAIAAGEIKPGDLAYVIYTSGSTGQPKGVMVEHAGMLNHLYAKVNDLHLNAESVVAFTASYTFDISVWQIFSGLLSGGHTIIYPSQLLLQPAALLEKVEENGVTILELVPSYLTAVLREELTTKLEKLQYLLVTGEAVSQPLLAQWFGHPDFGRIPVVNAYGPTEASDDICHYIMYETPVQINIPLGSPIQNLQVYVLNDELNLCPVGVTGEICVAGIGVSRGYLNRADLTAAKFIKNPFNADSKMYRTGDLGRWLADGNIEYLGRIDDQVKVRGFRIELGEIENVLQQYEEINQAVVVVKDDANGNKRLVAYLAVNPAYHKDSMLNWLKGVLPEYMVPSFFITLEELPLTPNGKIDKKALPDPDTNELLATAYVAPRNHLQGELAEIWQNMLGIPRIGIYDNFFELGGLSLLVIGLVSVIKKEIGVKVHVKDIFNYPTIHELAEVINLRTEDPDIAIQPDAQLYSDHVVLLNDGPLSFPVFMLPGAAGVCEVYSALGQSLNETCALYGLQMPGVFEGEAPEHELSVIAARNIGWMKEVQPVGPYRFIGHSLGGIMIHEMTKQLEAAGEQVQTGIILDKDTTTESSFHGGDDNGETLFRLAMLVFELGNIVTKPYPEWIWKLKEGFSLADREEIMPVITSIVMENLGNNKHYTSFILRILNLVISNAFLEYTVKEQINASLLIVKAEQTPWEENSGSLGWEAFATATQVITVPGDHDSLVGNDNVQVLGAELTAYLQQFKG
ncbi:non-ribosomal peptide synthetase [Pedobacter cryoconitis]|uniref:non-ribosomal peptide synthetase n=1 Tax=Pedobacter cryoconitis TaxID=188932 RepID=UPI001621473F|nr:non-ribosomal peptide synthase/polyketide synthase [Pedobacter cryoconitis]MBB5644623.1 amino acid adenylation domain-containing protein/non-ribosomal peptide synthase protein (TIGR01720 family) [Pedobacter cryoconitis]